MISTLSPNHYTLDGVGAFPVFQLVSVENGNARFERKRIFSQIIKPNGTGFLGIALQKITGVFQIQLVRKKLTTSKSTIVPDFF